MMDITHLYQPAGSERHNLLESWLGVRLMRIREVYVQSASEKPQPLRRHSPWPALARGRNGPSGSAHEWERLEVSKPAT